MSEKHSQSTTALGASNLSELRELANLGVTSAQLELGHHLRNTDKPENHVEAMEWFRRAAENGNSDAQLALAMMVVRWDHSKTGIKHSRIDAAAWLRKAAEQNNVTAQFWLALILSRGLDVPQNKQEAAYWWLRAAEGGSHASRLLIARKFRFGEHIPCDKTEAAAWLVRAVNQGYPQCEEKDVRWEGHPAPGLAEFELGTMLRNGEGVPVDKAKAAELFRRGYEQGCDDAGYALGVMLYEADGIPANKEEGSRLIRDAAKKQAEFRNLLLADAENKMWLVRTLVDAYRYGWFGFPQNVAEAATWERKSALQTFGYERAEWKLSELAELRDAAEDGDLIAQYELGMILCGQPAPRTKHMDRVEGAKWLRRAAERDHADAQFFLGYLLCRGDEIPQQSDIDEGLDWHRKAAEQGHVRAQYRLANMLFFGSTQLFEEEEGMFVGRKFPYNIEEAGKWFRRAVEQGHETARARLRLILLGGYLAPCTNQELAELELEDAQLAAKASPSLSNKWHLVEAHCSLFLVERLNWDARLWFAKVQKTRQDKKSVSLVSVQSGQSKASL